MIPLACWTGLGRAPGAYERLEVGTVATGLSASVYRPASGFYAGMEAQAALITVEEGGVRVRVDGGTPTSTLGHYLPPNSVVLLTSGQEISQFCAVAAGTPNAVLSVSYYW